MNATTNSDRNTSLMIAVSNRNFSQVQHLTETWPEQLHMKDQKGTNALLHCCASGSIEIFKYLVQNGMDTATKSNQGGTCLMIAAGNNNFSMAQHLVETYPGRLDEKDQQGWNALLHCCASGSIEIFKYLVQNGMDTATKSNQGRTCLMIAAGHNNFSMVQHLVETYPRQLDEKDQQGLNALLHCCARGSIEIFKYLVQNGMDTATKLNQGITCLMVAVISKNLDVIKYIATNYEEQLLKLSQTLFSYCCEYMNIEIFRIIVTESMLKNDFLNYAKIILNNNEALSMYIIEKYTTQLRAMKRWNPLPSVCVRGSLKVFDALISLGFDPNRAHTRGRTCLMYAAGCGHHALVQRILSLSSVDIHATDDDECTALHKCQSIDTSWEYLVKAGLSQKILNKKGRSPIQEVSKTSENIRKGNVGQLIAEVFVEVADVALKAYSGNALQQYLLLFNGVTEKYRHIRVVFLGPEAAGKTTLCQRLQRAQVDMSQRCPTNGGNIYQQLFEVEMDTNRWLRMEIELAITGRFGVLFKENQVLESNVTKEIIEEDVDDTVWTPSANRHRSENLDYAKLQEEGPTCGKALALMSPEETRNAMASRTGNRRDDGKACVSASKEKINTTADPFGRSRDEVKWNTDAETTLTTKLEQMVPLFNKLKRDFSLEAFTSKVAADTSPESFAFLSLWDMGGHFALQPSVHVFISGHGVYIITINMLECLQDEREVEKIRNWIRIVGTVSSHYTTNKRRQSHPPIIIVGTHMDLVRQKFKDQMKRDQRIENLEDAICRLPELSKDKGRAKYSILHFLKVDNSIQDDQAIEKLRHIILDAAELQDQWMREIPANWISLEREILQTRPNNPVLTLEEVAELDATCEKPIEDKAAISLFLEFLDCNRSVIYCTEFDTVITNPQWLLDAFSVIITDVQFMPNETDILLKKKLKLYQKNGLLTHSLVQKLFEQSGDETHCNHLDIILKLFARFGMIVKNVVSEHKSGDDDAYVVPSKLETLTDIREIANVIRTEARIVTKTLCFQFKGDLIPLETFDKIYAGILQKYVPLRLTSRPCQDNWCQRIMYNLLGILKESEEKKTKSIYRNFGCFAVNETTTMIVSVHWEQSCIAITLFSHEDNAIPGSVARSIRQGIDDIINKTLDVCKQDNIAYEYKLHCSYRLDHGDKPRDGTAILEIKGGVQCLGKECGRKHNLCKEDWLFWLSDLDDSTAQQDSKTQRDIKKLHTEMIRKLSLYINPRLPEDWKTFQTSMEQHLGRVDIFGTDVTGLSDICRTLMDKHIIRYGKYAALRSSVEYIHVEATTIIDDATSEIDKIKHQGQ